VIAAHKIDTHLGARLRVARRQQHLSKAALAARLGLSRQEIESYEAGEPLTAARLFQLAARSASASPISTVA
jgi:transcriptional regulator with XRE-family HTH domain